MIESMSLFIFSWVINYFIHSSLFIIAVLLAIKLKAVKFDLLGEWLMKSALVLGIFTALIQTTGVLSNTIQGTQLLAYELPITQSVPVKTTTNRITNNSVAEINKLSVAVPTQKGNLRNNNKESKEFTTPIVNSPEQKSLIRPSESVGFNPLWLLLWLTGVGFVMGRYLYQRKKLFSLLNHRHTISNKDIKIVFNQLLDIAFINKPIKLSCCAHLKTPIALSNEVVLPTGFLQQQKHTHIKAAMAHELAHIKRMDCQWLNFSQILQLFTFFQALNHYINQHIHQIAEQRADILAAQWTNNPKALVATLTASAGVNITDETEDNYSINSTLMVPAMTSKKSNLLLRVENILSLSNRQTDRYWALCFTALFVVILFTSPGIIAHAKSSNSNTHNHVTIDNDGSVTKMSVSYSNDEKSLKFKAKLKGDLNFNSDESKIISFPANSKFDLTIDEGGLEKRIVIKSDRDAESGQATYTYYEDGDEQPYNVAAQAWFAQTIPEVMRSTGFDAETRVERIQKALGDDGVLDEIALIKSSWVVKTYFMHLFELSQLNKSDLNYAMDLAKDIKSDFEISHVLNKLVETQNLKDESQWLKLLGSTDSIQSDFELAKTLINFLGKLPQSAEINQGYFDAAVSIQSDFELSKVLISYIEDQPANSVNLMQMFELATEIQSDFELAKVLLSVNPHMSQSKGSSDGFFTAYLDLAKNIQSDFEMKKVYSNLLDYDLSVGDLSQMIKSAEREIGSDFELANLLLEILDQKQLSQVQKNQIIQAAKNSISSSFERNKVLLAMI
jgi:beta-lactamase regulating signal transducer with metallopeptidase domain